MSLQIHTLGPFQVSLDNRPIPDSAWKTPKNSALFKVLLTHREHALVKDQLIEWLWPDLDRTAAEHNLRASISYLRRALEPELRKRAPSRFVLTTESGYRWNSQAACWLDADEFTTLCTALESEAFQNEKSIEHQQIAHAERARALYRGDYLEEDRYADWATAERERLRELFFALLTRMAELYAQQGRYRRAVALCREILVHDPCRESTYCQLMLYCYLVGDQSEAVRTYEQCAHALKNELGVEPGSRTKKLYEQVQARQIPEIDKRYPASPIVRHAIPYALSSSSIAFVGREAELQQLTQHLTRATQGQGRCVLISGEAGVGKTRLIHELLTPMRERLNSHIHIFQGRGHELGVSQAYHLWAETVRDASEKLGRETLKVIPALWLAEVAKLVPEVKQQMPELPENPPLPPQQEQLRFYEGLTQFFLGLAPVGATGRSPLQIVFLDDLHWADAASLDFLNYFLPRIESKPILILGTYRSEEISTEHPLLKFIKTWEPKQLLHSIALARLSAPAVIDLIKSLPLAVHHPDRFSGRLYQETAGNPLFLISTLQNFFEEGALRVEGQSWVTDIEDISADYRGLMIPPTVKELITRRIRRLTETEEKLLKLASVIGQEVEPRLLERAWEGDAAECVAALAGLAQARLLIESRGRYEFSHSKVREVVYDEISPARRELLHRRVLYGLEQFYAGRDDGLVLLAQHAHRAGEWKKSLEYTLPALKRAAKEYYAQQGLQLVELGLAAVQALEAIGVETDRVYTDTQRFELLAERSEIYRRQGLRQEEAADLSQLQELADRLQEPGKQALVFSLKGALRNSLGQYSDADKSYQEALALYEAIGDRRGQWRSALGMGNVHQNSGRYEEARRAYQNALGFCQETKDRNGQAIIINNIARLHWNLGDLDEALRCYQQALEIHRTSGERDSQASCLINIGGICWRYGRYDESLRYYQEGLEIAKEIGNRYNQGGALVGIGLSFWSLGRYDEALRHQQQALEIRREILDRRDQGHSLLNVGNIYRTLGKYDEARRSLEESLEIRREIGDREGQATSLANLGLVYHGMAQYEDALSTLRQALEISRKIGRRWGIGFSLNIMGDAYLGLGRYAEALTHYEQARALFEEMGEKPMQLVCLSAEGMAYLGLNELERALTASSQAIQMLEAGESCSTPQEIQFNHFHVLWAQGRHEEALKYLQMAYDAVMQRAERLSDAELRESFLKNVTLNREIVEETLNR
ncbi:tetratricopeptide repeat protein [Candidatus Acetothermia bacterium]|nr:tetratricopeptide repeat protein [Candidatus Acetothermia bacterium]